MSHKIYVGTYAKYNAGTLRGAWVNLADYPSKDEFIAACYELHKDETDPELMTQDVSSELFYAGLKEDPHSIPEEVFEIVSMEDDRQEVIAAFMEVFGPDWEQAIEKAPEAYIGAYARDEDMAWDLLESTGELYEIPEDLQPYFDIEKYARDLMISDFSSANGYYFMTSW